MMDQLLAWDGCENKAVEWECRLLPLHWYAVNLLP